MSIQHDERYKRAISRITESRRQKLWLRAANELGIDPESHFAYDELRIRELQEMKLGIRMQS